MKTFFVLTSIMILSSCSAKFSETNYNTMLDLVITTRDSSEICSSNENMIKSYKLIRDDSIRILEHSAGRKDTDVTKMIKDLYIEIDNFGTQLTKNKVSIFYCKSKIENINHGARTILNAEGGKL